MFKPYMTAEQYKAGYPAREVAFAYFGDLLELGGYFARETDFRDALFTAEERYRALVDCLLDEGDVHVYELRGFIDAVATMTAFPKAEREWLHDSFEWVVKALSAHL